MRTERLLRALELLQEEKTKIKEDSFTDRDELAEIVTEFLEAIYQSAGVQEIENKVALTRQVDTAAIGEGIKIISDANPSPLELKFSEGKSRTINPTEELKKLSEALDVIKNKATRLGKMEVLLRLEMYFDSHFDELLMTLNSDNEAFDKLIAKVTEKLKTIKFDQVLLLWARLKSGFSQDRMRTGFIAYDDIIPKSFWEETNSEEEIISRFATYIVKYKPMTILRMIADGYTTYPAGLPGVARILSLLPDAEIARISNLDVLLIRSTSRVVALYKSITYKDVDDLAKAIGTQKESMAFDGEFYHEYSKTLANFNGDKIELILLNMKRLIQYVNEFANSRTPIEEALWQFKMGQEVLAPSRNDELLLKRGQVEIHLQKELSKFLIERNILSFGTKFGRSEIDLYAKEVGGEDFVIEAKVYKKKPSLREIEANLVQLQSYMDQHKHPRGVLAIFNFTDDLILAPRQWVRGRNWVLVVNLCSASPSGRSRSLEIIESRTSGRLIDVIETGQQEVKKSSKSRSKKKTQKKSKTKKK